MTEKIPTTLPDVDRDWTCAGQLDLTRGLDDHDRAMLLGVELESTRMDGHLF